MCVCSFCCLSVGVILSMCAFHFVVLSLLSITSHSFSYLISVYALLEIFVCACACVYLCVRMLVLHSIDKNMSM